MKVRTSGSALLVGTLLVLSAPAPGAQATYTKDIQVSVTGSAVAGTTAAFSVKIANPSSNYKTVGSADITPPFQLVSPGGTGNTVKLRDLSIKPGKSLTVAITAAVPCAYTGWAKWDIDVKESKSFYGSELPTSGDPKGSADGPPDVRTSSVRPLESSARSRPDPWTLRRQRLVLRSSPFRTGIGL